MPSETKTTRRLRWSHYRWQGPRGLWTMADGKSETARLWRLFSLRRKPHQFGDAEIWSACVKWPGGKPQNCSSVRRLPGHGCHGCCCSILPMSQHQPYQTKSAHRLPGERGRVRWTNYLIHQRPK